jgi:three-Cys-motif partner protein
MPPRKWGWWTEQKLDVLGDYLAGFTTASAKAGSTIYLDLFAGQDQNVSRSRDEHVIRGSARRALDAAPPFSVLRFFELASKASQLDTALKSEYPQRDFHVEPGNCNDTIAGVLADLEDVNWAPTFAFLDQQSTEVRWSTLEELARFKRPDKWKTELWLLCASGLLPRGLRLRTESLDTAVAAQMTHMFGTDVWVDALTLAREGRLTGSEFRAELTNLMRWRLETVLGYKTTMVFKITNTGGSEIFDMIFATDHPVGEKIMKDIYSKAMQRQPDLRKRALLQRRQDREEKRGLVGMFDLDEIAPQPGQSGVQVEYEHVPPTRPLTIRA